MAYVGIDQSYTGFGVTVINATTGETHSALGKFEASKHGTGAQRLITIQHWLSETLAGWSIDHVCIEGYAAGAKFGREMAGELGAAVKMELWRHRQEITPTIVPPTSVKKFATGSGAAKKNEILLNVYKRWGVEFKDDNLADSFVLAKIAQAIWEEPDDLLKFQQEVISKLS